MVVVKVCFGCFLKYNYITIMSSSLMLLLMHKHSFVHCRSQKIWLVNHESTVISVSVIKKKNNLTVCVLFFLLVGAQSISDKASLHQELENFKTALH